MIDISRHREVVNPTDLEKEIHIIGVGATGSWLALQLSKMQFNNIHLYDFDIIEEHNIPNQNFDLNDLGKNKVDALAEKMKQNNPDLNVVIHNEKVQQDTELNGIVFLLTDTMSSRNEIFDHCIKGRINVDFLIETRMGVSDIMIYSVNCKDYNELNRYKKTLNYSDDEAEVSSCGTSLSLVTTATITASLAVWSLINYINNDEISNETIFNVKTLEIYKDKWNNF